ncbi:MAG: PDZ domain-containing protein, partial [Saprospiraceae bacterium]
GVAERTPVWSPDGKTIAYWSDQSGEYELWIQSIEGKFEPKKITSYGPGFRYQAYWSPNSKKLAFIDKAMQIKVLDINTGLTTDVDKGMRMSHGPLLGFKVNWSADSRWMAYHRDLDNYHNAVFIYDVQNNKSHQITSGYYECNNPVFDPEGKYLYLLTNQYFQPSYSDLDNTFIYANSTQLAAISLLKTTPSILYVKNDTVEIKKEENTTAETPKDKKKSKGATKDTVAAKKPAISPVEIDFTGIESRLELLPLKAGNYGNLSAVKGKIIFQKYPNTGASTNSKASTVYYDIEKREEKTIMDDSEDYLLCANGSKMLIAKNGSFAVIKPEENQKFEKPIRVNEMEMTIEPMKEWRQLLIDAWRLERDYFYDGDMHGVNWEQVKQRYLKMLEGVTTREELNFIIGEMIAELNASHTYNGGGDEEQAIRKNVGYLGINWQAEGNFYKIKNIIRAADWDAEVRSPLDAVGLQIKEGDYILAVNGNALNTSQEPAAFMQGLANKAVELTYNTTPDWKNAKKIIVQTIGNEARLRHLAWIESNRKWVDVNSNGEVGYIYVRSTGLDGQNELVRQFNAQWQKKALIIDERFNNGGQIPDRFVELLNREPLSYFAIRDGKVWPWPPYAHFGPKVMLINGWSGSGG